MINKIISDGTIITVLFSVIIGLTYLCVSFIKNKIWKNKIKLAYQYRDKAFKGLIFQDNWTPTDQLKRFLDEQRELNWSDDPKIITDLIDRNRWSN